MKKDNLLTFLKLFTIVLSYFSYRYVFVDYIKPSYEIYRNGAISRAINNDYLNGSLYAEIEINKSLVDTKGSLGSEMSYDYYFNGVLVKSGDKVKISKNGNNTLKAVYTESDDAQDDVGSSTISFNGSNYIQTKKTKLKVEEQGGRSNKGAYKTWEITYTITPVIEKSKVRVSTIGFMQTIDQKYYYIVSALLGWYAVLIKTIKKNNGNNQEEQPPTNQSNEINQTSSANNASPTTGANIGDTRKKQKQQNNANKQKTLSSNEIKCPKCGSAMVKRHGKHGYFYGCSNYPYCKGTRKIDFSKQAADKQKVYKSKKICQIDKEGNVVEIFANFDKAIQKTGVDPNGLADALTGKNKKAGGYSWKYLDQMI